jgi:hypothetical protein
METPRRARGRITTIAAATLLLLTGTTAFAAEASSIRTAIRAWAKQSTPPVYRYALVDLNALSVITRLASNSAARATLYTRRYRAFVRASG